MVNLGCYPNTSKNINLSTENSPGTEQFLKTIKKIRNEVESVLKKFVDSVKDVRSRSRVTLEWKGFDNKSEGTTLASACALCLDLLSCVWLHISGGLNCCQESQRGVV